MARPSRLQGRRVEVAEALGVESPRVEAGTEDSARYTGGGFAK